MLRLPVWLLAGCAWPGQPASGPLAEAGRWGQEVRAYRYERTTVTTAEGATLVQHERGEVALPDRQHIWFEAGSGQAQPASEVIVVGRRAWTRQTALGATWQPAEPGAIPVDPLTIALGTLAAAGAPVDVGERLEPDNQTCRGWRYAFEPERVAAWPQAAASDSGQAEATIWLRAGGMICGQTLRLERAGQPAAEYSVHLSDVNAAIDIQPPV